MRKYPRLLGERTTKTPCLHTSWILLCVPLPLADFYFYFVAVISYHYEYIIACSAFYGNSSKLSNLRMVCSLCATAFSSASIFSDTQQVLSAFDSAQMELTVFL